MAILSALHNDEFTQAVTDVAAVESTHFSGNGRYRQLTSLAQAGLSDPANVTIRVDVYQAPAGHGYVVIGRATVNGVTYLRSQNVGPESDRTHDWTEIAQENL